MASLFKVQDTGFLLEIEFKRSTEFDSRLVPIAVVGFSLALEALYALFCFIRAKRTAPSEEAIVSTTRSHNLKDHIQHYGGYTIYGFMLARLVGALLLLQLSTTTIRQQCRRPIGLPDQMLAVGCPEYFLSLTFLYTSILALVSLVSTSWSPAATRCNIVILLTAFFVYAYRDLWPLATYSQSPADAAEGRLLWVKLAVLGVTAVVIPLFIPRRYVPIDPKNPMPVPNDELTASWISRITFSYMDPVILLGSKVSHIAVDQLPPLCDEDWASVQTKWALPNVDRFYGARRRHLFFGLLKTFATEYLVITLSLCAISISGFIAPIGINRVLNYLEKGSTESEMKPWFWIAWLLIGPVTETLFTHWYLFYVTLIRVRLEIVITQLVFEHSLRIRLKAEVSNDGPSTPPSQASSKATSVASDDEDDESVNGNHASRSENETDSTAVASSRAASESTQATLKGKAKAAPEDAKKLLEENKKSAGDAENLIGKINNFVTSDLGNILDGSDFLSFVFHVPVQIVLCSIFLYKILGWSSIVGLISTIALSPAAGYVGKKVQDVGVAKMKLTDARVQVISESVGVLRMIKLFGWESKMSKRLEEKREDELAMLWRIRLLKLLNDLVSTTIPTISMLLMYGTFTVVMKEELNGKFASIIFSSMAVYSILRQNLHRLSWQATEIIEGKVSLDRINQFLRTAELLDAFTSPEEPKTDLALTSEVNKDEEEIGFRNATFAWSVEEEDGALTPSSRFYRLHIADELIFKRGRINLIIGPTGSGKTSMLMALLGEMHFIPSNPDSWFNLPRTGGVAYAAQESWVQNATIRDNILFGCPYDERRYKKAIYQCALERDLELFEAGDATEVGERGLTLSGGQKARVTLARAVYSSADIILLDDVLAALDVHTSAWIVDKCLKGDLVKGRTVLLVTHNVALAGPISDFTVSLGLDGSIKTQGAGVSAALANDPLLAAEVEADKELADAPHETEAGELGKPVPDGKLVMAEEVVHGHVTWKSMSLLLSSLGGEHPVFFALAWVLGVLASSVLYTLEPWWLGVWGTQYEIHHPSEVNLTFYISIFAIIAFVNIIWYAIVSLYYNYRTIAASRSIHGKLIASIFGSTLRWLDETPTARIIARCTQDIRTVDGPIVQSLYWCVDQALGIVTKLGVIVLFTPIFLLPGVAVACVGIFVGNLYLKSQLSVKREMSNARSPLIAHVSAAIHGIVSVRAYGAQKNFKDESMKRIDHYARTARTSWNLNRWVGLRIECLGAAFTAALAAYLVYGNSVGAANTGFSLNMAASFCMYIFFLIRIYNNLEVESNSLERIQGYIDIEHEPEPTESGKPPASWPTSGELRVEKLSARYSQTGPKVLHDISFGIRSGERIGIVGRTGSGKSSLTLALLRCILTEGTVYYDGIATNKINLDALRSNITIIPQAPELISGTLRQNLDPFDQHDDHILNEALRSAGLFSLQEDAGEARITLDTKIAGGGGNLSVGQRQILALARAMVRGSKLLILDEATSAIDYKTDAIIQSSLRSQLPSDVTVITIAHRLQTIMDADKIMVLDGGRIAEFDRPKVLLESEKGFFKGLVDGSGDKETLYALADK